MPRATERGEVWETSLEKTRPVIIISRDDVRGIRSSTTIAKVTSTIRGTPNEVVVDHRDGVSHLSAINCDDVVTVRKDRLLRRVGRLSQTQIDELDHALRFALGLR